MVGDYPCGHGCDHALMKGVRSVMRHQGHRTVEEE